MSNQPPRRRPLPPATFSTTLAPKPVARVISLGWKDDDPLSNPNLNQSTSTANQPTNTQKEQEFDFVFSDNDSFEQELNEFFSLVDVNSNQNATADPHSDPVVLLECLLVKNPQKRVDAGRALLAFAQGLPRPSNHDEHVKSITTNNILLFSLGALSTYRAALKHISNSLEFLVAPSSNADIQSDSALTPSEKQGAIEFANMETGLHLSLLFMLIHSIAHHGDESIKKQLIDELCACDPFDPSCLKTPNATTTQPSPPSNNQTQPQNQQGYIKPKTANTPLAVDLFDLVSLLAEGNRKLYPVKKLLVLLSQTLLLTIGNSTTLSEMKQAGRIREGLDPTDSSHITTKSTPQDLHVLNLLVSKKYPAYYIPSITSLAPPTILPDPLSTVARRAVMYGGIAGGPTPTVIQPLTPDCSLPKSIEEAVDLIQKNMYIGLREVQMSREMMELEGVKARGGTDGYDFRGSGKSYQVKAPLVTEHPGNVGLDRVEELYRYLSPNITVHIGMLIRLLYYVNLGNELGTSKSENQFGDASASVLSGDGKCDTLEAAEMNRNKEVVTLSISRIIWMLLKAFKCDNVLKFEYICQLLIDNNCAILILKMLSTWFQNPILAGQQQTDGPSQRAVNNDPLVSSNAVTGGSWLKEREEPSELNFFNIIPPSTSSTTTPSLQKGSYRAFQTTAHLLRILQKLTSRKPHRLLALVQWKASAVLKRIIKVPSPPLQLPALKLLKSQVPYMGKKWRAGNMRVIAGIYGVLKPRLVEEWLSGDGDAGEGEEALAGEQYLRSLIACYHHRVYPDIYPPPSSIAPASEPGPGEDELEGLLKGLGGLDVSATRNRYVLESEGKGRGVDDYFKRNWEAWVRDEVYGGEEDGDAESEDGTVFEEEEGALEGGYVHGFGYGVRGSGGKRVVVDEFDWGGEGEGVSASGGGLVGEESFIVGDGVLPPMGSPVGAFGKEL